MLGLFILILSIILFFNPKYRAISYLIFLGFISGSYFGYNILIDKIIGFKNPDLALIYALIILCYFIHKGIFYPKILCVKYAFLLMLFTIISCLFSYFYYEFTLFQVIQGARQLLLVICLFIFIQIDAKEFTIIFKWLFKITLITSIIYIFQIIVGQPLMPYPYEYKLDAATGLVRLYNLPPYTLFYLVLCFVNPTFFGKKVLFYKAILLTAIILTLGRTTIITSILTIILALILSGNATKALKSIFIIGLLLLPLTNLISDRFTKGNTSEDFKAVLQGNWMDTSSRKFDGTFTYRMAWVYERVNYLAHRPIAEQIFGLGMISDSQPIVNKMYNFNVGFFDEEKGEIVQLYTGDNAYGNIIVKYGFLGGAIYLAMLTSIIIFFYRRRRISPFFSTCAAILIMKLILSLSGAELSRIHSFALYFIIIGAYYSTIKSPKHITHKA